MRGEVAEALSGTSYDNPKQLQDTGVSISPAILPEELKALIHYNMIWTTHDIPFFRTPLPLCEYGGDSEAVLTPFHHN